MIARTKRPLIAALAAAILLVGCSDIWYNQGTDIAATLPPFAQNSSLDLRLYDIARHEIYKGGQLKMLPLTVTPLFMVYNKEIARKAGVTMPEDAWTWDQFHNLTAKLTHGKDADKVWGFYAGRYASVLAPVWVVQAMQTGKAEEEAARDALSFLAGLIQSGAMPGIAQEEWMTIHPHFAAGKAAVTIMTINELLQLKPMPPEYEILPMPTLPGARSVIPVGTFGYSISAASQQQQAAWDLLAFLAGPDAATMIAQRGSIPFRLAAAQKRAYLEARPTLPRGISAALDVYWYSWFAYWDVKTRQGILALAAWRILTGEDQYRAMNLYDLDMKNLKAAGG